jgi:hypothetical protein
VWSFVFSRYETSFPYSNAEIHDKPLLEIAILSTHDIWDGNCLTSSRFTTEGVAISERLPNSSPIVSLEIVGGNIPTVTFGNGQIGMPNFEL